MRARLAAVALLAGLLASSLPAAGQSEAFYEVNDVEYYYAAGTHASGHLEVGPEGASQPLPFTGCGWAKLRPDNNKGRIQVLGNWGLVPVTIDMNDFADANQTPDALAGDLRVPSEVTSIDQPVEATMMATANATVRLGPSMVDDPVTGLSMFQATWYVTPDGFRGGHDSPAAESTAPVDPEAPEPVPQSLGGDWEMHMRVVSHPDGSVQGPTTWTQSEPSDGTPYLAPDEAHSRVYPIPNERLFGKATLTVQANSLALDGSTALVFNVYASDGTPKGSLPLSPALNVPESGTLEFPLDQVGFYFIEVQGQVSLANYEIEVQQQAPEEFVLDLWWDDVRAGYAGLEARQECSDLIDGSPMTGLIQARPPPVAFDWPFSLFTVAAALTLLVVAVTFTVAAYQWVTARRAIQG